MLSICSLIRKAKQSLLLKINLWKRRSSVWGSPMCMGCRVLQQILGKEKRKQLKIMKCGVTVNKRLWFNSSDEEMK